MRTLSPTLLAAQRSLAGVPSVRVRVEDRELRWAALLGDDSSTRLTAACAASGGILRARVSATGTVDIQRITDPSASEQWQSWTPVAAGVAGVSDVAISAVDGDPDRVRLFYVRPDGPSYRVSYLQSSDAGQTWSTPDDVVLGLDAADASLASADAQLLFHDPADGYLKLALRGSWASGSWTVETWAASGALAGRYGLAMASAAGTYHIASCDQEAPGVHRLRTGTYTLATGAWSTPVPIVPPGIPSASFVPMYPSLVRVSELWYLAYLETFAGVLAYADPVVVHAADWDHWSFACSVPLEAFGPKKRAVLVHHGGVLYLSMECTAWRGVLYDAGDSDRNLSTSDVLSYLVEEGPYHGCTAIELYNPGDRYGDPGQPGEPGAALRPLARVVLERGYRTAAGEERVDRSPYYVIATAVRRGGRRPSLQLGCEDGWGLLRRWRPDALYAWSGRTIAWLIAEVLYRAAGLTCDFDGNSNWNRVLDSFAIGPGNWARTYETEARAPLPGEAASAVPGSGGGPVLHSTGLAAVRTLLDKVSGRARWEADGSLYCFIPWAQALGDPYVMGSGGEILDALYGHALAVPNQARVFGDSVAALAISADPHGESRRYIATHVDPHLLTADACGACASGLIYDGQAGGLLGWVETPCQCGLELYDLVAVDDPHAGRLQTVFLRAAGIVERYDPARGVYGTRVALERA